MTNSLFEFNNKYKHVMFPHKSDLQNQWDERHKEFLLSNEDYLNAYYEQACNTCKHEKVPFIKSQHPDVKELVQRGTCPDCNVNLLELD